MKSNRFTAMILIVAIGMATMFTSCNKDDETPDYRKESVGNYTYNVTITLVADANETSSDNGLLKIEESGDGVKLIFDAGTDGEITLSTSVFKEASNGYAFNITTYSGVDGEGDSFQLKGIKGFSNDGTQYDGVYDSGSEQIEVTLLLDYTNNEFDIYNQEIEFLATKQ